MGRRAVPVLAADDAATGRYTPLSYMAEGYRPSRSSSIDPEQQFSDVVPMRGWEGQKGSESAGGAKPPPGAVSAYSSVSSQTHQADFTQSTLNLVTCVLGAGALGYPFCFKECGLLLATIIMFATLVATRISYQLLLYCAQLSGRKSYESIAEYALGRTGRQIVEFCIAAMNLGALVAFLDILADVLSSVAGTIIPPGAEPSRHAYIAGVTLFGALPMSLIVREPSLIANMSNAAVVFVVVFAVVVFCTAFGPSAAAALGVRWAALTHDSRVAAAAAAIKIPVLHMWNPQGVLVSLPVMAYGFTAHQYYMGIYTMLKAPTVRKMKLVTDTALLVCAGVYWTVGVGGYATFGDRTAGDIIRNFGGQRSVGMWGAYERALKLCYGMAVLGNIPLVIMPFCSILSPLLPGEDKLKQQTSNLASACTVAGAKRVAGAALSGCGGGSSSGSGSGAYGQKARFSGSGDGRPAGGGSSYRAAGSAGELALQVDAEPCSLEPPTWQQHSSHLMNGITSSSSSGLDGRRDQQWQQQQQQQQQLLPQLRTQQQLQMHERQPLLCEPRPPSPEEAPEHPHVTRDAARAAHLLTGPQHTLVVVLVLGLGLASAVWLPNVELIFGLTGSTASVLAAFIMPAMCFLRLYEEAPELGSGKRGSRDGSSSSSFWAALQHAACCCGCCGLATLLNPARRSRSRALGSKASRHSSPGASKRHYAANSSSWAQQGHGNGDSGGASSPSKVWGPVLVVPELRAQWAFRQRLAFALLAFGFISGLLCTDAILSSISEEKAVVQLAQELVAHEAVVAETSRAQQKAKEAAAAVDAVSSAAQQLGAVDSTTNQTLGSLAAAAAALNTIATPKDGVDGGKGHAGSEEQHPSVWDLKGRIEQHKQKAAEDSVLRNVEAALTTAAADISATTASVTAVIIKLDTSIAQIKADAAAEAATAPAHAEAHSSSSSSTTSAAAALPPGSAGAASTGIEGVKAPDGSVVLLPTAGSTGIIPHAGGTEQQHVPEQQQQQQQAKAPVPPSAAKAGGSSGGGDAFVRASDMARELGKALGTFGKGAAGADLSLTAGKSLEQVRDSAVSALTALNVTADVLRQLRGAVAAARNSNQPDSQVKDLAVQAMQRALNATAASALAMRITQEALGTAATEETSELLTALTRVAHDLEKSDSATGKKRATITVSRDDSSTSSSSGGAPEQAQGGAVVMGAHGALHTGSGSTSQASQAGSVGVSAPIGAVVGAAGADAPTEPTQTATAVTSSSSEAASSTSGSTSGADSASTGRSADGSVLAAETQQQQPKTPTLQEHDAAAAAAANAAAHVQSESTAKVQPQQQEKQQQQAAGKDLALGSGGGAGEAAAATPGAEHRDNPHQQQQRAGDTAPPSAAAEPDAKLPQLTAMPVTAASGPPDASAGSSGSHSSSARSSDLGDSSSGSGTVPSVGTQPAGTAAPGSESVLSATEASKVKDIIGHLTAALASGGSTTGGTSGGTGSTTGQGNTAAAANITKLAAAIHDAVTWTEASKSAVLGLIVKDLGQTDPKVAQRVMGIVQEVGTTETPADRQAEEQNAEKAAAAALDAAVVTQDRAKQQQQQEAADDAKGASPLSSPLPQQVQQPHQQQQQQQVHDSQAAITSAAGPVVAVKADGKLHQQSQSASGVEGPVVTVPADGKLPQQEQQQQQDASAAAAASGAAGPVVAVAADGKLLQQPQGAAATEGPVVAVAATTSGTPAAAAAAAADTGSSGSGAIDAVGGSAIASGAASTTAPADDLGQGSVAKPEGSTEPGSVA